ncbi:hypothetical protein [Streptomyces sp. NBC_01618]|uniref:hypothetical protein n=1 Tax=Streptomyces sp. NBC_01618 TaxID=2975900 RepID=UPI00386FDD62|nr:hypothetical protein OH735_31800 [Streptomyces sp. NBC_01618]
MRWDNPVENPATAGNSALFTADAVTTRTFDTPGTARRPRADPAAPAPTVRT